MLNTKLGFFYVHRFARLIYEVTRFIYETYGCLFPNIYCSSDASMCWFGDLTGNRQPFVYISVNLPVYSQTNTCIMKKELTAGTKSIPAAHEMNFAGKLRELVNRTLPSECQIQTTQDAWYVGAIGALCVTFLFPPAVAVAAYCVYRAKKEGGAR